MRGQPPGDATRLADAVERWHPDPFRAIARNDFRRRATATDRRAREGRDVAVVELMRTAAALGERDGHTGIFPLDAHPRRLHVYPLVPYEFEDGVFVVAAASPELVGLELRGVGGIPVDELLALAEPLVPADNAWTVRGRRPMYLITREVLRGLGATGDVFDLRGSDAVRTTLDALPASAAAEALRDHYPSGIGGLPRRPEPAYLAHRHEPRWTTPSLDGRTVYVAYNVTRGDLTEFAAQILELARRPAAELVVLDLRLNGGGDNTTYGPLLDALEHATHELGRPLAVLIGRATFSAAMQLVVDLERRTPATFVGEPTGGSPNQYGDARNLTLPDAGLRAHVATIAWATAGEDDTRVARAPDLAVPLASESFFAGRDPTLERALTLV